MTGTLFFSAYCVANIVSPQTFLSTQAPKYTAGVLVTLAAFIVNSILFSILYAVYLRENAARRREIEEGGKFEVSDLANVLGRIGRTAG